MSKLEFPDEKSTREAHDTHDRTELVFILDKSGSMQGLEADTVGGYNSVLEQNRRLPGEATVSTVLFDTDVRVLHDRVPIDKVPNMRRRDFRPSGCTALLDAVGGAIKYHSAIQRALPAGYRADHVLFAIMTDGYENASTRFTYPKVKRLIEEKREEGWEFMFLAAGIDTAKEADSLGIDLKCAVSYDATPMGTAAAYRDMCLASINVREGRRARG